MSTLIRCVQYTSDRVVLTEVIAENKRCLALCRGRGMGRERGGRDSKTGFWERGGGSGLKELFGLKGKKGVLLVTEEGNAHWGHPQ